MNESDYDAWQAKIADAKAARRRKKGSVLNAVTADTRQRWDSTNLPLKFDDLVDTWQRVVLRFVQLLRSGSECRVAWDMASPSTHSKWPGLDPAWRTAVQEVCDGF